MLHKEIPFLRIIVPLCLGIIAGKSGIFGTTFCIILCVLSIFFFLLSLFYNARLLNHLYGFGVSTAIFSFGIILAKTESNSISQLESRPAVFLTTISEYPAEKEKTYMFRVELKMILSDSSKKRVNGSMIIYHRKDSLIKSFKPGDILLIKCTPNEISGRGNPCEFDYKAYMASRGTRYFAYTGTDNILAHSSAVHRKLKHKALIIRERIIKMFEERGVKGERLAIVSAITLGQKNLLDPDARQIFINAGVMHIMAVSGLHVIILSLFFFNVLFFMKGRSHTLRVLITTTLLWAFAFVTGLSSSVIRATLMFTFIQAGNLMNRKANRINSVLASAFFLIIIKPSVITDAGFLLSYSAVIYIIGFYDDLYRKIHFRFWLPDKIWQSVAVTLVAQAGTLPLTIMLFNRFPVYFMLTNVIIVPLANLLIIAASLVPLTYHFVPVSEFLASLLDKLTGLTEYFTRAAASLPYSTIDRIGMTPIECVLLTVAISLLIFFLLKKNLISIHYPVSAFIIFSLALSFNRLVNHKTNELIVYNTPSFSVTGIKKGNTLYLYSSTDSLPKEVIRHAATMNLRIKPVRLEEKPYLLQSGTSRILITDSLQNRLLAENKCGIVILTGTRPYIEKEIKAEVLPKKLIISSEVNSYFNLRYNALEMAGRTVWYIRKSGAYICRLD